MFAGFRCHAGCPDHGLHRQLRRDIPGQAVFHPGIGQGLDEGKDLGRAAAGQAGYRIHLFFRNGGDSADQ